MGDIAQWQVVLAVVIFLVIYAVLVTGFIHRAVMALVGALFMIGLGIVDTYAAFTNHMKWEMIFLLIGMMIIFGITNRTGLFQYVAIRAAQLVKGNPLHLLIAFTCLTAITSAFLDNVTTVLLLVPITLSVTRLIGINPVPYLISVVLAANIGGVATMVGDPPNMMIGTANRHLTFNDFIINITPVALVVLVVTVILLAVIYKKQLTLNDVQTEQLMSLNASEYIVDKKLMIKAVVVLLLTITGFAFHAVIQLEVAVIAIAGATLLLLIGVKEEELEDTFQHVDWLTIRCCWRSGRSGYSS